MKTSKYNYIVPFGEKHIFFNGITEAFFLVPSERKDTYRTIIENPDKNKDAFESFVSKMKVQGFVVDDGVDEMKKVKEKFNLLTVPEQYFLLVLPTYQCNLRCWYCVQNHENLFMTDEVLENLKMLIRRKLSDESIKELHLSWFGGEPLLAYDKVLSLTLFARDYADENGKGFSSAVTSNGTLLTPERIDALRDAGVVNYQITIDGDRDMHNSIKKLGEISAYDRTLDNINLIARHTHVNLRFNYTHDNLRPRMIFESLRSKLNPDVVKNINFTIFKVWQEDQKSVNERDVDRLFNLGMETGMRSSLQTAGLCYADHVHYDCVLPNGRVGKCDNHSPEDMPGMLQSDGTILWGEDMTEFYRPHLFEGKQKQCETCGYLPICWGPCVAKREAMLKTNGMIGCMYQDKEDDMKRLILNTCKTRLQVTQ